LIDASIDSSFAKAHAGEGLNILESDNIPKLGERVKKHL